MTNVVDSQFNVEITEDERAGKMLWLFISALK